MRFRYELILAGSFAATAVSHPSASFKVNCESLAEKVKLNYTFEVNIAEYIAPNTTIDLVAEGLNATCSGINGDPIIAVPVGVCRLNLRVETSESSEIYAEVWLPENWEGRVLTTGNGGLAGCRLIISWRQLTAISRAVH
jgi:feruloyl esterase